MATDIRSRVVAAKVALPSPPVAVRRERLLAPLDQAGGRRVALVTGPAGSGKTTLLAQYAAGQPIVAWYRAEPNDGDEARLLLHLGAAVDGAIGATGDPWPDIETATAALEDAGRRGIVLVVDDLHDLEGTPAEAALLRLAGYLPPGVALVMASRVQPRFNLSRLRLSGDLVEIHADDLRFRSWEIERLFADVYQRPLAPDDVAELARRTEGWAAALQLFHLATQAKRAGDRRRFLQGLSSRTKLVREYLAQNVLDELPSGLRAFVLDTCVLGRLTGRLCDRLLDRQGSDVELAEIERRQLFLSPVENGEAYRYHDVFRSYLADCLIEQIGEAAACERYARAAALLEDDGASPEAFEAYCRAGDQDAARRLLGVEGATVVERTGTWFDAIPPSLVDHDPWLLLVAARRHVQRGQWSDALARYRKAEDAFGTVRGAAMCRTERMEFAAWTEPTSPPPEGWSGRLLQATRRDPARWAVSATDAPSEARLGAGLAAVLAGRFDEGATQLQLLVDDPSTSTAVALGAKVGAAITHVLRGNADAAAQLAVAREELEEAEWLWLARIAAAAHSSVLGWTPSSEADRRAAIQNHDFWGAAVITLLKGYADRATPELSAVSFFEASDLFARLGAGVLEAVTQSLAATALSATGHPDAAGAAARADALARSAECRAALPAWQQSLHQGLEPPSEDEPDDVARVSILCLGDFSISVGGTPLDQSLLKPRARSLLRLLSLHAGRAIHREAIMAALWPDADTTVGTRNVQVAISSLRHFLETADDGCVSIAREGSAYRLVVPEGTVIDFRTLEHNVSKGRTAAGEDPTEGLIELERAMSVYRGDLLDIEGSADWVLADREHYRLLAVEAAELLAQKRLEVGDFAAAASACEWGLHVDRYRDGLWKTLVTSSEQAGDMAAAARHRGAYATVLQELGL